MRNYLKHRKFIAATFNNCKNYINYLEVAPDTY